MHEAAFELIEIPHVRQSGKNSADIRMVVDALDLCYTKSHLDTFVILRVTRISLHWSASCVKTTSMWLASVSRVQRQICFRAIVMSLSITMTLLGQNKRPCVRKRPVEQAVFRRFGGNKQDEQRRQEAIDLVMTTVEGLFEERGEEEKVWGSMVKQALKRRQPGFNERYHGFSGFGNLLEEAEARGLMALEHDEKSGGYVIKSCTGEG
ncbi:MAG: hypothetical protein CM1200mP41_12720 [Gammaproteobacteria bacterium]|nr:MAG: hypothetical protein CM1200mP41_12720 [Gammaproteobacteria bacterium]